MTRQKWIALGLLSLGIFLLIQELFHAVGISTTGKVGFYLFLAVVGFLVVNISLPKEYQKFAQWIPTLCVLILLTMGLSSCVESCRSKKPRRVQIGTVAPAAPTGWYEDVEMTGKEYEGKPVLVPQPGWHKVEFLGGAIYDGVENKVRGAYYRIWGTEYAQDWKQYFPYSRIPGVRAVEALLIADGEIGSGKEKVFQFPDAQKSVNIWVEKYIRFFRHEALKPDINGNIYWCYQNNFGSWSFRIQKADL